MDPKNRTRETRREIARWILFLKSNEPYRWPVVRGGMRPSMVVGCVYAGIVFSWLLNLWVPGLLLTFACIAVATRRHQRRERSRIFSSGPENLWPFFSPAEFTLALRRPPYFAGAR